MLTVSVRMKFLKKVTAVLLVTALAGTGLLWAVSAKNQRDRKAALTVSSNEDRIAFLQSAGWIPETMAKEQEILIPVEFNDFYQGYNEIQKEQGFDLSPYRGKKAMQYLYPIKNYESGASEVEAALIVSDGLIIGADLRRNTPDGFLKPLSEQRKD